MKFFVLVLAVFLRFTFTTSDNNETYTLINSTNLAKPDCESRCGDLIVPYPFGIGIGSNCSINKGFDIDCDNSSSPPRASFTKSSYTSIKRISDSTIRATNIVAKQCEFLDGSNNSISYSFNFTRWPYTISTVNKFTVLGCDGSAWLTSTTKQGNLYTGCIVFCTKPEEVGEVDCTGNGCCQSSISQDINYYTTRISSLRNSSEKTDKSLFAPCTYAFVGDPSALKFKGAVDLNDTSFGDRIESDVPLVLDWAIGNMSCAQANGTNDFACRYSNSMCVNSKRKSGGYRCICKQGYEGNPYLSPGCQDINECAMVSCFGVCDNTEGNYTCKCKDGYSGDPTVKDGCRRKSLNVLHLSLGLGLGLLTLLIGLSLLHITVKQRKLIKLREELFEQNGGVLLESKLKTTGPSVMKIFQVEELEKATNNYADDNILGRGGNGTVYKGTLLDTRIVAIKKSQRLDRGQRDQFINEMVILAQINHPNVVQLLGCCLETDVPLLAYEFVPNDTLHSHIHNRSGKGRLSWDSRLRIAHESAGALAYLHNDARMSIIHRDVKSSNILLDDNYIAKIADFGASRLVPLGHDQVTTLVQGTIGHLDPEYFHTGHLTDKSDVYSFGVVLAELLTGRKPIDPERGFDDTNLAIYFLKKEKENRLLEILDHQVVKEATDEQLKAMCDLVCRCISQVGANRPSMKDVTMKLETLRKSGKHHSWISQENYTETSSFMIESEEHDTLKNYVRNQARPEGCIAEGYIAEEALTFCSRYLGEVKTKFNCAERNEDVVVKETKLWVFQSKCRPASAKKSIYLNPTEKSKLEWFVLDNCLEARAYIDEFKTQHPEVDARNKFPHWFLKKLYTLKTQKSPQFCPELHSLSMGVSHVNTYTACIVNGVRFMVLDHDECRTTQNSGVSTTADGGDIFYGQLLEIIELLYPTGYSTVLFRCKWFDTSMSGGVRHENNITSINTTREWDKEDQLIFATQATQVFYIREPSRVNRGNNHRWVVENVNHRSIWDRPINNGHVNNAESDSNNSFTTTDQPIEDLDVVHNHSSSNTRLVIDFSQYFTITHAGVNENEPPTEVVPTQTPVDQLDEIETVEDEDLGDYDTEESEEEEEESY